MNTDPKVAQMKKEAIDIFKRQFKTSAFYITTASHLFSLYFVISSNLSAFDIIFIFYAGFIIDLFLNSILMCFYSKEYLKNAYHQNGSKISILIRNLMGVVLFSLPLVFIVHRVISVDGFFGSHSSLQTIIDNVRLPVFVYYISAVINFLITVVKKPWLQSNNMNEMGMGVGIKFFTLFLFIFFLLFFHLLTS